MAGYCFRGSSPDWFGGVDGQAEILLLPRS
jgi:hypothetical protein